MAGGNTTRKKVDGSNGRSKPNRNKSEQPEFNFDDLSLDGMNELDHIKLKQQIAADEGDHELLDEAVGEMKEFLARLIVSIPASWVVTSAPATIDWSNPENLGAYLKGIRLFSLWEAFNEAQREQQKK